jgi:hypothetical protein
MAPPGGPAAVPLTRGRYLTADQLVKTAKVPATDVFDPATRRMRMLPRSAGEDGVATANSAAACATRTNLLRVIRLTFPAAHAEVQGSTCGASYATLDDIGAHR